MFRILLIVSLLVPSFAVAAYSPSEEIAIMRIAINNVNKTPNHPDVNVLPIIEHAIAEREEFMSTRAKDDKNYIIINLGSQWLISVENNKAVNSQKVIVGRESRETPIFSDTVRYIVTNPYWNVPSTLASADVIPRLKNNTELRSYLGYELIDTATNKVVAWQDSPDLRRYRIRQIPGSRNVLGTIKFMFDPSPSRSIYLHDTPDRYLFNNENRRYSSGSIRLEHPLAFGKYLMDGKSVPKSKMFDRWIPLKNPKRVHIVDWSVNVNERGNIIVNSVIGDELQEVETDILLF